VEGANYDQQIAIDDANREYFVGRRRQHKDAKEPLFKPRVQKTREMRELDTALKNE